MTKSLPAVSKTALGVAGLRAMESTRPDRLFEDPYAAAFFEAGRARFADPADPRPENSLGKLFYPQVVIRTHFYDEYLLGAGCEQVVILAAGLDTRAFRLDWPEHVRLFELDLPDVLAFKEDVLAEHSATPRCTRTVVPVDLREDWPAALLAAGFQPTAPTAWLAEGLLIYLSREEAVRLLTLVGELSAPGSRLSFEHRPLDENGGLLSLARKAIDGLPVTKLWKGGLGGNAPEWLTEHGWQTRFDTRSELAVAYGRASMEDPSGGGFVTAVRH